MPAYDFENKETGEQIRLICSFDDIQEELARRVENPEYWERRYQLNMSSAGGRTTLISRTSEGFKDRLRAIKKANPGSTIDI